MNHKLSLVITGSSKGIGFGLAQEFLKHGHSVLINGTTEKSISLALDKVSMFKNQVFAVAKDVRDDDFVEVLFSTAKQKFGKVDIWINNAGIAQPYRFISDLHFSEINTLLSINLLSVIRLSKNVYNLMTEQGYGKIFNMEGFGSDGRKRARMSLYGTSKRALSYFTESFAKEVVNGNVQIGTLSPGMVVTGFLDVPLSEASSEEKLRIKKAYNILGTDVGTLSAFFYPRIIKSKKNNDKINYLTNIRLFVKLISALFSPKDYFLEEKRKD